MSTAYLVLALLAQVFLVGGQLLIKEAMVLTTRTPVRRKAVGAAFAGAIGLMTVWYFVWLFCKQQVAISVLIVFEGVNPALLVVAAMLLLHERIDWKVWTGTGLIVAGILASTM